MNENNNTEPVVYAVGTRGYSAYEVAVQNGFIGTEQEWLDSLVGPQGELGPQGKSAYEIAVENGYVGTEQQWVNDFLTPDGYYSKTELNSRIVDNLESMEIDKPLSARQGNVLSNKIDTSKQEVIEEMNDAIGVVESHIENESLVRGNSINSLEQELNVERERINNITTLEEGSTTGDAELIDIRTGDDSRVYSNAGNAVRDQIKDLKTEINDANSLGYEKIDFSVVPYTSIFTGDGHSSTAEGADYEASDYIAVNPGEVYAVTMVVGGSNTSNYVGVAGYDENKDYTVALANQKMALNISTGRNLVQDYIFKIPEGTYYMRGCSGIRETSGHNYPTSPLIFKKVSIKEIKYEKIPYSSILSKTGRLTSRIGADYEASDYIAVNPGEVYAVTMVVGGGTETYAGVAGYDKNKQYNARLADQGKIGYTSARHLLTDYIFKIPEGTYFMRGCSCPRDTSGSSYPVSPLIFKKLYFNNTDKVTQRLVEDILDIKNNVARNTFNHESVEKGELISLSEAYTYISGTVNNYTTYKKNFTLAGITDIHNDTVQWDIFLNKVNDNTEFLDCAICTGDMVKISPAEDLEFYDPSKFNIPLLVTLGNHDAGDPGRPSLNPQQLFTKYIQPLVASGMISADKLYYYKDFENYKIRIISLNEYENTIETNNSNSDNYRRYMTSEQLQWFADTLYNTPTDYSVIVLTHQIIDTNPIIVESPFTVKSIYRKVSATFSTGAGYQLDNMIGNPIGDIVNAFKHSTLISKTYENRIGIETGGESKPNSTVLKDFTDRENGKFICYISGHCHAPYILRDGTYNDQMQILMPSGSESNYQRGTDDIFAQENVPNFYYIAFDTTNKLIKLVKVGDRTTLGMDKRDTFAIKYEED